MRERGLLYREASLFNVSFPRCVSGNLFAKILLWLITRYAAERYEMSGTQIISNNSELSERFLFTECLLKY